MSRPLPFAHHSLLWKPLPANRTASRTGASLAPRTGLASSPQTRNDSIHGQRHADADAAKKRAAGEALMVHRLPHGKKVAERHVRYTLFLDISHAIRASPASRPRISRNCRLRDDRLEAAEKRWSLLLERQLHLARVADRRRAGLRGPARSRAACGRTAGSGRRGASSQVVPQPSRPSNSVPSRSRAAVLIGRSPRSRSRRRPIAS